MDGNAEHHVVVDPALAGPWRAIAAQMARLRVRGQIMLPAADAPIVLDYAEDRRTGRSASRLLGALRRAGTERGLPADWWRGAVRGAAAGDPRPVPRTLLKSRFLTIQGAGPAHAAAAALANGEPSNARSMAACAARAGGPAGVEAAYWLMFPKCGIGDAAGELFEAAFGTAPARRTPEPGASRFPIVRRYDRDMIDAAERLNSPPPSGPEPAIQAVEGAYEGWPLGDLWRVHAYNLARLVRTDPGHYMPQLDVEPPLTGTPWDAAVAAIAENTTEIHGCPPPAWVDKAERFVDPFWSACEGALYALDEVFLNPPAFTRHGAGGAMNELTAWEGEPHEWSLDPGEDLPVPGRSRQKA